MRVLGLFVVLWAAVLALGVGRGAVMTSWIDETRFVPSHPLDDAYPYQRYRYATPAPARRIRTPRAVARRGSHSLVALPALGGRIVAWEEERSGTSPFWRTDEVVPLAVGSPRGVWAPLGGVELCFPSSNHAHNTLSPWRCFVDGDRMSLSATDRRTGVDGGLDVRLVGDGSRAEARAWVYNPNPYPVPVQAWLDFAFPLGAEARLHLDATTATAHAPPPGEAPRPWPGTSLDRPGAWPAEAGWFLRVRGPRLAVTLPGGAVFDRVFAPQRVPGVKLWSPGGSGPYFEVWGGSGRDFASYAPLGPYQTLSWTESWSFSPGAPVPLRPVPPPSREERPYPAHEAPPPRIPGVDLPDDARHRGYHALALGDVAPPVPPPPPPCDSEPVYAALHAPARLPALLGGDGEGWRETGLRLLALGETGAARRCLEQAVDLNPGDAIAWLGLDALGVRGARRRFQDSPQHAQAPCGFPTVRLLASYPDDLLARLYLGMAVAPRDRNRARRLWTEAARESKTAVHARRLLEVMP